MRETYTQTYQTTQNKHREVEEDKINADPKVTYNHNQPANQPLNWLPGFPMCMRQIHLPISIDCIFNFPQNTSILMKIFLYSN